MNPYQPEQLSPRGGWLPPEPTPTKDVEPLISRVMKRMPPGGFATDSEHARATLEAARELVKDQGGNPDSPRAQQFIMQQLNAISPMGKNPNGATVRTLVMRPDIKAETKMVGGSLYERRADGSWVKAVDGESPVKLGQGESLVRPEGGGVVASIPPKPTAEESDDMREYNIDLQAKRAGESAMAGAGGDVNAYAPAYMAYSRPRSKIVQKSMEQEAEAAKLASQEEERKARTASIYSKMDDEAAKLPERQRLEYGTKREYVRTLLQEKARIESNPMMLDGKEKTAAIDAAMSKANDEMHKLLYPDAAKETSPKPAAPKKLDADTARTFLKQAGGDKAKARQLAKDAGYEF